MSMKRTLAIVAAAAMMMAQPLTTLAATPGDNLTPQFEIHDAGTTATVDFSNQTSGTTTAPAATQAPVNTVVPAGTPHRTPFCRVLHRPRRVLQLQLQLQPQPPV